MAVCIRNSWRSTIGSRGGTCAQLTVNALLTSVAPIAGLAR